MHKINQYLGIDRGSILILVHSYLNPKYTKLSSGDSPAYKGNKFVYAQALFGFGHESAFMGESNLRAV
jgi:hypothetical protein